jgi:ABC-2 type transport system ATP-binding protein
MTETAEVETARPPPAPSAADEPPLLALDRIRVKFGSLLAVRDVSLALRSGDLLGLIGPNGAGKTTLLRVAAGLQPVRAGQVWIAGRAFEPGMSGAGECLRLVGFTPDTPPFYEQLTVRDFLRFIARGYDLAGNEIEERIDFWLEKVWLTEKAGQKIAGLSRGMRQRIGIARTLLPNPAVVLLDEPAAGLDPGGRVQFRQLLCELRAQGKALIVSSHILSDMAEYCTHIGIMAGGAMVQYGTVAQVAGGDAHVTGRCRYTAMLARPVAGLEATLASLPEVSAVQVENERVVFEYAADRASAARLLADLIARGIPVASFAPNMPGLEEAYLRSGIGQVD